MTYWFKNAIETPDGTILECKTGHDYQVHKDGVSGEEYMNDGIGYYIRRSINEVQYKDLSVTDEDSFGLIREVKFWKSYGKDAEFFPQGKYLCLSEMDIDHLSNIMNTQFQIKNTPVHHAIMQELQLRWEIRRGTNRQQVYLQRLLNCETEY
jgi:hypothetical protein